jgi:hypothetical protein
MFIFELYFLFRRLLFPVDALVGLYLPYLLGAIKFIAPPENVPFYSPVFFDMLAALPTMAGVINAMTNR